MGDAVDNSTGPWHGIGFWDHPGRAQRARELEISDGDRAVLRPLAERVALLADRPGEARESRALVRAQRLEGERPLVLADPENGWNEIVTEADLACRGALARAGRSSSGRNCSGQSRSATIGRSRVLSGSATAGQTTAGERRERSGAGGRAAPTRGSPASATSTTWTAFIFPGSRLTRRPVVKHEHSRRMSSRASWR